MNQIRIEQLPVGMLPTNCYVLHREGQREAVVVDPGGQGQEIAEHLRSGGLEVKAILLTHGHHDHIDALAAVRKDTGAPVYACEQEQELLADPEMNLSD